MSEEAKTTTIDRLNKTQYKLEFFERGEAAGAHYALNVAEYPALRRLSDWFRNEGYQYRPRKDEMRLEDLVDILTGHDGTTFGDVYSKLEREYSKDMDYSEMLAGFIKGALQVFRQLEGQLESYVLDEGPAAKSNGGAGPARPAEAEFSCLKAGLVSWRYADQQAAARMNAN